MTIKQQGGIFGRNPTFNEVDASTIDTTGDVSIGDQLAVGTTEQNGQLHIYSGDSGASRNSNCNVFIENNGSAGISIGTPSANAGFLMFADEGGTGRGFIQYDHTTDYLNLAASGSTRVSIQGNNIALNNGGGIDFSATSGTGTSELFDDYEEGTWTPTVGNQTVVGSFSSNGAYTKIGRQVFFRGQVIGSTSITGSSGSYIGGLPFISTASGTGNGTIANQSSGAIIFIGPADYNIYIIGGYSTTGNFEFSGMYFA
jgi:hypothetical protein